MELILLQKEDDVIPFLPQEIVDSIIKIKDGFRKFISFQDDTYQTIKIVHDVAYPEGNKKEFALSLQRAVDFSKTLNKDIWTTPMFQIYAGKASNMRDFIQKNKKRRNMAR